MGDVVAISLKWQIHLADTGLLGQTNICPVPRIIECCHDL